MPRTRVRIANFLGAVMYCAVRTPFLFLDIAVRMCACYSRDEVTADTSVRTHESRARAYAVSGEPPKEATRVIVAESCELLNELWEELRRRMGGRGFGSCEKVIMTRLFDLSKSSPVKSILNEEKKNLFIFQI